MIFESNNILTHLPISPLGSGLWSFRGTLFKSENKALP